MKYGMEINQPDFPAVVAERGNSHFDGSGNKVIDVPVSPLNTITGILDGIVGDDVWDYKECANHLRIVPTGLNNDQMAVLVNSVNTLVPLCAPFFCFGTKFRDGWARWASPVLDRFTGIQIGEASCSGRTIGIMTNTEYGIRVYRSTALTMDGGMEIRLCEQHPRWLLPPLHVIETILDACLHRRGKSIKLVDHFSVIKELWGNIADHGVYDGLKCTEVSFFKNRGIPYIVPEDGNDEKVTINAFDLFKKICRRFVNSGNHIRGFEKVLAAFENEVDVSSLPRDDMWFL